MFPNYSVPPPYGHIARREDVQENTAEYRSIGGRIGYDNGGYTFEQFMKDKGKVDSIMNEGKMRKLYEEMMRKKKVQMDNVPAGGIPTQSATAESILSKYQVNELKTSTLKSYLKKARDVHSDMLNPYVDDYEPHKVDQERSSGRVYKGDEIARAKAKLAKRGVNELSTKTLKSYTDKASSDVHKKLDQGEAEGDYDFGAGRVRDRQEKMKGAEDRIRAKQLATRKGFSTK